ncbi:hypothetical protein CDL15_Pgr025480 [Punica granatum]|uniref:WRKY domain-containing protein n=1 Tax=Punica granatum TaxID=22663 RepID=A0A218W9S1_PUNGR|nr:hypothetical protein CDL15_Pgr025480 [Punica granatum]
MGEASSSSSLSSQISSSRHRLLHVNVCLYDIEMYYLHCTAPSVNANVCLRAYSSMSYFKCQRANCNAKKRAEWSASEPGDLRVVYEGIHTHGGPPSGPDSGSSQGGSSADANRYNLLTQVLGDQTPPHDPSQTGHQYN